MSDDIQSVQVEQLLSRAQYPIVAVPERSDVLAVVEPAVGRIPVKLCIKMQCGNAEQSIETEKDTIGNVREILTTNVSVSATFIPVDLIRIQYFQTYHDDRSFSFQALVSGLRWRILVVVRRDGSAYYTRNFS